MLNFNTEKPQSNENSEGLNYVNPGLPHVTFVVDFLPSGEFRFVRVNSLYESVMGLAPEMIQGKTLNQLFPEAIAQRMAANFTRSWQLNQSISYEELWPAPGGEDCWIFTLFPLSNEASSGENYPDDRDEVLSGDRADNFPVTMGENSPVNRLIGSGVNLTELQKKQRLSIFTNSGDRHKAENQLVRTQTRFETALKNSPIVVFQQDLQLCYTWVYNPHPGFDSEAFLGKTDLEMFLPEDAVELTRIKQRVLDREVSARQEIKTTIEGEEIFYDLTVEPLYDSQRHLIGITCAAMDITNQKRTEMTLQKMYQRLRFHVENTPLGVIEYSCEYQVQHWSKTAEKIFGWKAEEVIGINFKDWHFIHPEDAKLMNQKMVKLLKDGENGNFICTRNYTKNGSIRYCEWYNSTLRDESGNLISILSLIQDVTDRVHIELKLKKALKKLKFKIKI